MNTRRVFLVACLALAVCGAPLVSAQRPALETIDIPGATTTSVNGVNDRGDVVGAYTTPDNVYHGFVRVDGRIVSLDVPGPTTIGTQAIGINARGDVVGLYETSDPCVGCPDWITNAMSGFLWRDGHFWTVDVPGSAYTIADGINASGVIVGEYWSDRAYGFRFDGATYQQIDQSPGPGPSDWSASLGVNAQGQLAGWFGNGDSWEFSGYLLAGGRRIVLDPPGAAWSIARGVNARGAVLGVYYDDGGAQHTYLWTAGAYSEVAVPGATWTYPGGLNDRGDIVGQYGTADGGSHGFLLRYQAR